MKHEATGSEKFISLETLQFITVSVGTLLFLAFLIFYEYLIGVSSNLFSLTRQETVRRVADISTLIGPLLVFYSIGKNHQIRQLRKRKEEENIKSKKTNYRKRRKKKL